MAKYILIKPRSIKMIDFPIVDVPTLLGKIVATLPLGAIVEDIGTEKYDNSGYWWVQIKQGYIPISDYDCTEIIAKEIAESAPCECGCSEWVVDRYETRRFGNDFELVTHVHCFKCNAIAEWLGD